MHVLPIRMSWKSFWIFHILYLEFSGLFYYLIIKVCCCFLWLFIASAHYILSHRQVFVNNFFLFVVVCFLRDNKHYVITFPTACQQLFSFVLPSHFVTFATACYILTHYVLSVNNFFSEAVLTFQPTRFFFLRQRNIYYHAFHQLSISFLRYKNFLTEPVYFIGNEKFLIK